MAAMNKSTLACCTQEWFGFTIQTKFNRFNTDGWFGAGQTKSHCSTCGELLWAFRKPYTTTKGEYLYWALVCANCRSAIDPASLSDTDRKLLYKSSNQHVLEVLPSNKTFQTNSKVQQLVSTPAHEPVSEKINQDSQCLTCKHAKNLSGMTTCVALQFIINIRNPISDCVHYNNLTDATVSGIDFIDKAMKSRAGQDQSPEKFRTDDSKYFNKIKRK